MPSTRALALAGAVGAAGVLPVGAADAANLLNAAPESAAATAAGARHALKPDPPGPALTRHHAKLVARDRRLARQVGRSRPVGILWSDRRLRRDIDRLHTTLDRRRRAAEQAHAAADASAASPQLEAIAACESGGNPQAVGGGGAFRGKYQFTYQTWASVGGTGDPAAAPVAEQDRRAAMLLAQSGTGNWPICGR